MNNSYGIIIAGEKMNQNHFEMKNILLLFALIMLFVGCNKDDYRRMKYRVVSKSTSEIAYEVNNKWFYETQSSGDWSKSYRVKKGTDFHLLAYKTGLLFDVTILVYFDGDLYATAQSNGSNELLELKGQVPD
jgi:hypothetical protein